MVFAKLVSFAGDFVCLSGLAIGEEQIGQIEGDMSYFGDRLDFDKTFPRGTKQALSLVG
jgi:hypothetical protein